MINPKALKYNLLLFDDDVVFYELLKKDLEDFCHIHQKTFFNSEETIHGFDAVLIDLDIHPELRGEIIISYFKENNFTKPLLILSSDENQMTKNRLLKMGVDDYLWKSMPKTEIQIRIENAIRRNTAQKNVSFGNLILSTDLNAVIHSTTHDLSKIEYKFLNFIFSNYPQSSDLSLLQKNVWNQNHVNMGTINTLVWQLNKKLHKWNYRISVSQNNGIQLLEK